MCLKTKIGLGTAQFGTDYGISNKRGQTSKKEVKSVLKKAYELRLNLIDTAIAYGNAEDVLGNFEMNKFNVVSKFMPTDKFGSIDTQLEKSLRRLRLKSLYGFLAHRPNDIINCPEKWDELLVLKEENKVKKIGFSLNSIEEIESILNKGFVPDLIQVPYNYLDKRFEDYMIFLKKRDCEIHTRSTFLQGLFFLNPMNLEGFFKEVQPIISNLQRNNENLAGSLLAHSLNKQFIDKVIVGVENTEQLIQNIREIENAETLPELNQNFSENILNPSLWQK